VRLVTIKTRSPSKRVSRQSINCRQPDLWDHFRSNPTRKGSVKSLLSVNSGTSEVRRRNSGFLGRHRTPSTPEFHYPQRSSSFCVPHKFRSVSLCSLNRIPRRRKESLFIDVKSQRVFLKPTSNSPITPVNVRHRILRQEGKKIPVLTPLWIIHPQHNKDLSSTGAMAFDTGSLGSGRIISVSDDVSYYSPTAYLDRPRGQSWSLSLNFEEDLASLPLPLIDQVYVGRQPTRMVHNQLERVHANVPEEQSKLKSLFKKLRERLAHFCCFNSD
jgi:hypothetical protein